MKNKHLVVGYIFYSSGSKGRIPYQQYLDVLHLIGSHNFVITTNEEMSEFLIVVDAALSKNERYMSNVKKSIQSIFKGRVTIEDLPQNTDGFLHMNPIECRHRLLIKAVVKVDIHGFVSEFEREVSILV